MLIFTRLDVLETWFTVRSIHVTFMITLPEKDVALELIEKDVALERVNMCVLLSRSIQSQRYLKGQPKLGLWYPRDSSFDLVAYSDSDYAGASLDRKATTGGCQFLGCRLILWQCKKQTVVATSSTEAEYVATASCYGQGTGSGSGPRCQDTILGDAKAQIRFEAVSKYSNDPPLSRGNTLRSEGQYETKGIDGTLYKTT
ncbi:hypothetical protein Tco_0188761 [Tanacetum coccineum]